MSMLEQVENQVMRLSIAKQLTLRDEFKAEIKAGMQDIAAGGYCIHRP